MNWGMLLLGGAALWFFARPKGTSVSVVLPGGAQVTQADPAAQQARLDETALTQAYSWDEQRARQGMWPPMYLGQLASTRPDLIGRINVLINQLSALLPREPEAPVTHSQPTLATTTPWQAPAQAIAEQTTSPGLAPAFVKPLRVFGRRRW